MSVTSWAPIGRPACGWTIPCSWERRGRQIPIERSEPCSEASVNPGLAVRYASRVPWLPGGLQPTGAVRPRGNEAVPL